VYLFALTNSVTAGSADVLVRTASEARATLSRFALSATRMSAQRGPGESETVPAAVLVYTFEFAT